MKDVKIIKDFGKFRLVASENTMISGPSKIYCFFIEENEPDLLGTPSWRIIDIPQEFNEALAHYFSHRS